MDHHHHYHHPVENMIASKHSSQIPVFARIGRGLQGDSYKVEEETTTGEGSGLYCDGEVNFTGIKVSSTDGYITPEWELKISDYFPRIAYELWSGVRLIDGVYYNGWWLKMSCKARIDDTPLWEFETPFTPTTKYDGTSSNEDTLVSGFGHDQYGEDITMHTEPGF